MKPEATAAIDGLLNSFISNFIFERNNSLESVLEVDRLLKKEDIKPIPLTPMVFDLDRCNRRIQVSSDSTEAFLKRKGNWCTVISKNGFPAYSGIYTFEVDIKKLGKRQMLCIGLVNRDKYSSQVGTSRYSCGWQLNGDLLLRGIVVNHGYGNGAYFENCKILATYDSNEGKLSFSNATSGENYGTAFIGLHENGPVEVCAGISFHEIKDCVKLLGYSLNPVSFQAKSKDTINLSHSKCLPVSQLFNYFKLLLQHCITLLEKKRSELIGKKHPINVFIPSVIGALSFSTDIAPIYCTNLLPIINKLIQAISNSAKADNTEYYQYYTFVYHIVYWRGRTI